MSVSRSPRTARAASRAPAIARTVAVLQLVCGHILAELLAAELWARDPI
jgi:hypothetical protein